MYKQPPLSVIADGPPLRLRYGPGAPPYFDRPHFLEAGTRIYRLCLDLASMNEAVRPMEAITNEFSCGAFSDEIGTSFRANSFGKELNTKGGSERAVSISQCGRDNFGICVNQPMNLNRRGNADPCLLYAIKVELHQSVVATHPLLPRVINVLPSQRALDLISGGTWTHTTD
ncbi:hypothetical protein ACN27G_21830 [Plantactinospora sp. WMMB334]|uniref:hypothetical protein n=1 Tax=Plantactinospora sp. WMMB334 TaxID=3404119 RepID=UPI003B941CE9